MSGGVDSSVAAMLLKNHGYDVVGVFMKCWTSSNTRINADFNADGRGNFDDECQAERDAEDARRVAGKLEIPFYIWDFEEEYKKKVVAYMVDGYRRGITPNPDVMCNKEIKFGLFLEKALSVGAPACRQAGIYVATGHYVRLMRNSNIANSREYNEYKSFLNSPNSRTFVDSSYGYKLYAARDAQKDQSYFLWTLTQEQLQHCLFPIGNYLKSEVRAMARKAGLPTAEKKDSQGICFLGKVTLAEFLGGYLPAREGAVLNTAGEEIGRHSGAHFYTIGQRHIGMTNRGLTQTERGLMQKTDFKPLYVAEKNVETNTLVVAEGSDNSALYRKEIKLHDVNFINSETIPLIRANKGYKVLARVRYRQPLAPATLMPADDMQINADKNPRKSASNPRKSALLIFEQGQKFVAAGQSAVFYYKRPETRDQKPEKYEMLGGGTIR